jgi:MFS family permease
MEGSSLIQIFTYASVMASTIFIPIIAQGYGAGPGVIGLLVGAYNLFFLLSSYIFGILADKYGGKYILRAGLFLSALFFAAQILANDVFSLFIVRSLTGAAAGIFPAALAVYAYAEAKGKMGKFSGYGSLGWAIGSILAGLIAFSQTIFIMSSIFFVMAFFISLQMDCCFQKPRAVNLFPLKLIKHNARIYIPYFLRNLGAQTIWSIFPLYLIWIGADKLLVGVAYFINTFSQFFIMRYVEKFKNLHLINIGLLFTVATFMGYALFPSIWPVLFFQLVLGFSFSTLQVGSIQELLGNNMEQSTAMALLNSVVNLTAVIGPFFAGAIAQYYGYSGVMWFATAIAFLGLVSFTTVIE